MTNLVEEMKRFEIVITWNVEGAVAKTETYQIQIQPNTNTYMYKCMYKYKVRWPKQKPAKQENLSGEPWYQVTNLTLAILGNLDSLGILGILGIR